MKVGETITVIGSEFTPPNTISFVLTWSDTISGAIVRSEIEWGPQGGPTATISIPRQPYDSGNAYQFTNLNPNQTYQFRVRDWDETTCTPWSAWKIIATPGSTADQAMLWLDNDFSAPLATVAVQLDGTFTTPITIPNGTSTGTHLLNAQMMGGPAAWPFKLDVIAANATYTPTIELIDTDTQTVAIGTEVGLPFTLRGNGWAPGPVSIAVDSTTGLSIGQVNAGPDTRIPPTTFTMPPISSGPHQFVAWQTTGGNTATATAPFFNQQAPT